jgi:hypothetical protein
MSSKNVSLKAGNKHDVVLDECAILWILKTSIYSFSMSADVAKMT